MPASAQSGDAPGAVHVETWSGAEAFHNSWALYAGTTLAPAAWLDPDLRVRFITGQSVYRDQAAGGGAARAVSPFADALLGLQKQWGALTVKTFAGLAGSADLRSEADAANLWQHVRLAPKIVLEAWWARDAHDWVQLDASWAARAQTHFARVRGGRRVLHGLSLGLEGAIAGNETGASLRAGPVLRYEWSSGEVSVSGGYAGEGISTWAMRATGGSAVPSPYATVNWLQKF